LRLADFEFQQLPSFKHFCLELDLYYLKQHAEIVSSAMQSSIVGSIYDLSLLVSGGKTKMNSLPHISVKLFAPMLKLIVEFVRASGIDKLALSTQLLAFGEQVFETIQSSIFQVDKIVILVYRLFKLVVGGFERFPDLSGLSDVVSSLYNSLEISKIRASNMVWKKRGTITLFRKELIDINIEICEADSRLNFWTSSPHDWFLAEKGFENIPGLIIDCISTLHFLNSQNAMDQSLLDSMKSIPQVSIS
jgi:hypothetical protein